jgi:hypothetical protein
VAEDNALIERPAKGIDGEGAIRSDEAFFPIFCRLNTDEAARGNGQWKRISVHNSQQANSEDGGDEWMIFHFTNGQLSGAVLF